MRSSPTSPQGRRAKWAGHEVHPGLFVGDLSCALDLAQLRQRNITHVLTATNRMRPVHPAHLHYLVLDFPDAPDQNLLDAFAVSHRFILEAHAAGGAVLVHCMAGQSRSVTVALSFIMKEKGLSVADALSAFRAVRPDAKPIAAFEQQLTLFERLGYNVPGEGGDGEVGLLRKSSNSIPVLRVSPDDPAAAAASASATRRPPPANKKDTW